ncbi:copia protein [Tanacetum coccineum]|uniref:Copia protein n=1 Tax=Tanacetum coccineum TaxID=301880 RepID=A0ABQ5EJS0_9ASTR
MAHLSSGLESLEARIVIHEKNEASYEESIAFLKYDVQVKDISIKNLKNQLEEALKEKDDLKLKLENFKESSKNLTKLTNSQISVKDKTRLGFDSHVNKSEVLDNVVDSHECNQVNDRFKKNKGYHAVLPPFTGNFKPKRADLSFAGLDDSVYTSKMSETITIVLNVETTESDSEDEIVFEPKEVNKTVKSSFKKIEFVNARNSTVEKPRKFSQNPRDNKRNRNSFKFTKKACFVCGGFNYLIKDCDFHDKNMVQKHVLNNVKKRTSQREVRKVWNNAIRINHQNFSNSRRDFAPIAILIKSGIIPISAARQSSSRARAPTSAARPINTAAPKPFVDVARPKPNDFHKSHSPSRTPFYQQIALKNRNLNDKVNIAKVNSVNTAKGNKVTSAVGEQGIDDFSRFSWVFFLATKDETPKILKNFITSIENQSDHKVKTIKSDNGTEFKNRIMNEFCKMKGRKHALNFMRPFGCPDTILNTLDHLGTRPNWMFDIDTLSMSMNYQPVFAGNQTNSNVGTKANIDAGQAEISADPGPQYVLLPFLTSESQNPKSSEDEIADDAGKKNGVEDLTKEDDINGPGEATNTNRLNTVSSPVNTVSSSFTTVDPGRARDQRNEFKSVFGQDKDANSTYRMFTPVSATESSYENLGGSTPVNAATPSNADYPTNPLLPDLEDTADLQDTGIFGNAYDDEDVGVEADLNNLERTMSVSPIPTTKIHKDHPKEQIIRDINSATQTRRMIKMSKEHAMISYINKQRRTNHKDYQNCLFACFLSQMEPKKVIQALADSSWVEAIQEELLQFRLQKTQEEGIDYDNVFAPVARIEAIKLFLAYASFMGFIVYQMDVKSAFLYGTIEEEVNVCQPPGFEDPQFPNKVYKVDKALYGLHQAPKAWYETLSTYLIGNGFRRGTIDKTLFIKKDKGDILSVQVYVDDIDCSNFTYI